jgi:hydrogenase nickel incorporation protein HypA/HybF
MHELDLMRQATEMASSQALRQGSHRIHAIVLRVGDLSGVVPEALAFAFEVTAQGTLAEGATLRIERVPIWCRCRSCQFDFEPADAVFACPLCGRASAEVLRGRELELVSLEVS